MLIPYESKNEELVMALWTCNLTPKEIAKCLNLTFHQVQYYRAVLRTKLGAKTFHEVIDKLPNLDRIDELKLIGQHTLYVYENARLQRRLFAYS